MKREENKSEGGVMWLSEQKAAPEKNGEQGRIHNLFQGKKFHCGKERIIVGSLVLNIRCLDGDARLYGEMPLQCCHHHMQLGQRDEQRQEEGKCV